MNTMKTFEITYSVGSPEAVLHANGFAVDIVNCPPSDMPHSFLRDHHCLTRWISPHPVVGSGSFSTSHNSKLSDIGNLTFIPSDCSSVGLFPTTVGPRRAIVLRFARDMFDDLAEDASSRPDPLAMASLNFRNPHIDGALRLLANEARVPGFASASLVESVGASVLIQLVRHFQPHRKENRSHGGLPSWQMRLITERISDPETDLPSIAELAALVGISDSHLRRSFKERTGEGIVEYIQRSRFNRACTLLTNTNLMIKDIAAQLGFSSQYGFTLAFRRIAGETPRTYRTRTGKGKSQYFQ